MGSLFVTTVFAAGFGQATLTVRQVFTHNGSSAAPPNGTFTYRLTPAQPSNPMPAGSNANGYTFTITGADDIDVGPITFTDIGKYAYEIRNITSPQSGYTYDQKVYALEIWVDNSLNVAVVVYNENGSKAADIEYEHAYTDTPDPSKPDPSKPDPSKPNPGNPNPGNPNPGNPNPGNPNPGNPNPGNPNPGNPNPGNPNPGNPNPGKPDYPGKPGPVTGDEARTALYVLLIIIAGVAATGSVTYLLLGKRRGKERDGDEA